MIILLLPLSYTAQNLPAGYPLPYNPLVWATQLVRSKPCPGYFGSKPCSYQAIAQVPDVIADVSWSCLAGAFCLGKGFMTNCTAGFYCPINTAMPGYCPAGFTCSLDTKAIAICPRNQYCPIGTVGAGLSCGQGLLAACPEGTETISKFGLVGLFFLIFIIIGIVFHYKNHADIEHEIKRKAEIKDVDQNYRVNHARLNRLQKTFDIEFQNIGCILGNGIEIMGNVSGALRSGRCMAIMGPSGAGKTTFVTLLTGKVRRTTGLVLINGVPEELSKYSRLIGYVPQEDIMLRELTVRDILVHSARMRLPKEWSYHQVKDKVIEIINFLDMSHVANTIIGDETTRGISGGQRKRVNIGMELVAEPSVLFLDEPTSGLDSSTSFEVCSNLRNIAEQQGLTVAAVIHSPSPATFKQFHDFMLLGKGGHLVYIGPREKAVDYFETVGFTLPADESPADFFMDVVTGKIPNEFNPAFAPIDLFKYWELKLQGQSPFVGYSRRSIEDARLEQASYQLMRQKDTLEIDMPNNISTDQLLQARPFVDFKSYHIDWRSIGNYLLAGFLATFRSWYEYFVDIFTEFNGFLISTFNEITGRPDPIREIQPPYMQLWFCCKRAFLQNYQSFYGILSEMVLHFCAGLFISIAVQKFDFKGAQPLEICSFMPWNIAWFCASAVDNLNMAGMFVALGCVFAGISIGSNTFGREMVVYWRDSASGYVINNLRMSTGPYFLAKVLMDIPRIILGAIFFSISAALFFPYRQSFASLFLIILMLYTAAFGMGYFISTIFPVQKVALIGTGFALLWALVLSGVVPNLRDVEGYGDVDGFPKWVSWLWSISAPRWAIEAFWLSETSSRAWIEKTMVPVNGYVRGNYALAIWYVFSIALLWFKLAFLGLKLCNRSKTK